VNQNILAIDATLDPALMLCVSVSPVGEIQVKGQAEIALGINSGDAAPALAANDSALSEAATQNGYSHTSDPAAVKSWIDGLADEWVGPVVILPAQNYLSLNLDLPFADNKSINKVLNLEVQDLVPFDVSEFLLHHRVVGKLPNNSQDVHVAALSRSEIEKSLAALRRLGFEPMLLCPPSSALAAVYDLMSKDFLAKNAVLLMRQDLLCYMVLIQAGKAIADRVINLGAFGAAELKEAEVQSIIAQQVGLTLSSINRRSNYDFEKLYLVGGGIQAEALAGVISRPIEELKPQTRIEGLDGRGLLAGLSAVFLRENDSLQPLSNFRIKEFAYKLPFHILGAGLKKIAPLFLATLGIGLLSLLGIYYARANAIHKLKSSVSEQIHQALPGLSLAPGQELQTLSGEVNNIELQLKSLGSPSKMTPIHALYELSKHIPQNSGINIRRVNIAGLIMKVEGEAPDYAAVDKLKKVFDKRKRIYCHVDKKSGQTNSYGATARQFSFELELCD